MSEQLYTIYISGYALIIARLLCKREVPYYALRSCRVGCTSAPVAKKLIDALGATPRYVTPQARTLLLPPYQDRQKINKVTFSPRPFFFCVSSINRQPIIPNLAPTARTRSQLTRRDKTVARGGRYEKYIGSLFYTSFP